MDKQALKTVIATLLVGDTLTINFLGDKAPQSGELTVTEIRKGRGKGGSLLVDLRAADGSTVSTGTPDSNNILNVITADGNLHGYETEDQVPVTFEPNRDMSVELKGIFARLEAGQTVDVEATVPEFAGTFTVVDVTKCRGRGGQLQANLQAADGSTVGIMNHRHSGVVTSFVPQVALPTADEAFAEADDADVDYVASVLAAAEAEESEETVTEQTEETVVDDETVA